MWNYLCTGKEVTNQDYFVNVASDKIVDVQPKKQITKKIKNTLHPRVKALLTHKYLYNHNIIKNLMLSNNEKHGYFIYVGSSKNSIYAYTLNPTGKIVAYHEEKPFTENTKYENVTRLWLSVTKTQTPYSVILMDEFYVHAEKMGCPVLEKKKIYTLNVGQRFLSILLWV